MKKLLTGLTIAMMALTMTACAGPNANTNQQADSAAASDSLADDFRFNTESAYYGYNEKEQTALGVNGGRFTFVDVKDDKIVEGTVSEAGNLTSETDGDVSYSISDGKIKLTIGNQDAVLDVVGEDRYVTVSQLLCSKIDKSAVQDDISGNIPERDTDVIPYESSTDTDTSLPDDIPSDDTGDHSDDVSASESNTESSTSDDDLFE